ncbi:GntR family transcriptional regulator [Streptosporangium sp. NPDC051022]|uniref:GntR family transcriptional regulator n=1 Tax=Streptosporangium sp. NPDC051022 TaxID=3155752 RepID=UPI0034184832
MDTSRRAGDAVAQTHEQLRELILGGRLLPGQRLTQRELAELLDVGRTPLREALRMLEAEGFVTSRANYGITVAGLDLDEAEELYSALLLLQPPLLRPVSEATLERMAALAEGLRTRPGQPRDFHQDHIDFHLLPGEDGGPTLQRLVSGLYERLYRLHRFYYNRKKLPEYVLDLNDAFLAALRESDLRRARRVAELQLLTAAVGLITDVDPWHRFGPLARAAAGAGIELPLTGDGTLVTPVEVRWAEPLPGYTPVINDHVVDVTASDRAASDA